MRSRLLPLILTLLSVLGCSKSEDGGTIPIIVDFQPARAQVNPGGSTLLLANFLGGTATVDQGVGPISSGIPISITPAATTTYTLTLVGSKGDVALAKATVTVGVRSLDITPVQATLAPGGTRTFSAVATGVTSGEVTWFAEQGTIDAAGNHTAPGTPGTYLVSATSTEDKTLCAKAVVTVSATPIVVGPLAPAAPTVSVGAVRTFSTSVSGGVSNAVTWTASAGSINPTTGRWTAPATAQTVTIRAISVEDPTQSASTDATVVALPVISAFTLTDIGSAAPLWVFDTTYVGGTGTIDRAVGAIASGVQLPLGGTPLDIYTLTVTNAAGDSDVRTVSAVQIQIESPSNPSGILPGGKVSVLTSVFNATDTSVTFTASPGSITPAGDFTAPMGVQVCTITVTSVADPSKSILLTVNVTPLVYPQSQVVAPGATFIFRAASLGLANPAVTWSLNPASGGSVSPDGVFTSNGTPGTFTITATSAAIPTISADAFITVPPSFVYSNTVSATSGAPITTRRTQAPLVRTISDLVLASGGLSGGAPTASLELFNPSGQFWTVSGVTMATPRSRHTATLLPTGKILLAGGRDAGGNPLASAELYDPLTDTLAPAPGPLVNAREDHTATLMRDGRVLLAGGRGNLGTPDTLATLEIFDPATNAFSPVATPMSEARVGHAAEALLDGRVFLGGGSKDGSDANLNASADLFDPVAGTLVPAAGAMASGRRNMGIALGSDGQLSLLGGVFTPSVPIVSSGGHRFNPATTTFSTLTSSMSAARNRPLVSILADGTAVALGGSADLGATGDASGTVAINTLDVYNPLTTAFPVLGTNIPAVGFDSVTGRCILLYDGTVLVAGDQLNGAGAPVGSVVYQ